MQHSNCCWFQVKIYFLLLIALIASGERVRYDNYHVYKVKPTTLKQLQVLQSFESADNSVIFLNAIHYVNLETNVMVAPQSLTNFLQAAENAHIAYELLDENAQTTLEAQDKVEIVADANRRTEDYTWDKYHELNDTYNWMYELAKKYPQQVSTFVAGRTHEEREMLGLKISYAAGEEKQRKGVFIEAGIHAREWISPATATYIINQLLTSSNAETRKVAENYVWYIVPHTNPDGYIYTHNKNRMWRKTRTPYARGCFGADPNRNWDIHWNEVGASSNPCSETYAGIKAFSEAEARSLADYIMQVKDEIFLYVSFHSYSQLLLYPYGYSNELPANNADLKRIYNAATKAVSQRYGTKYTGGNIYDAIYPTAGSTVDWAYSVANIKYAFVYELRPSSAGYWTGFRLPANQIIPTGEETLDSLIAMIKEADSTKM